MWPFRKKFDLLGFKRDKVGNLTFDLTEEEQQEVENTFKIFEGYKVNPDSVDDIKKGTTALALSTYAGEQVVVSEMESQKENREKLLKKAIAAITKAYSIYHLPIYLYDLACFMEMYGKVDESKHVFRDFLKKQRSFKPNQLDVLFLRQRDINEAIKDAETKVKRGENMIKFLKSIGGFIIGIVVLIGTILLAMFFIKGGVWLGEKVLPWFSVIMWLVFALDILIILPLGIFKKTKGASAIGLIVSSYVYGLTLWFWALLLTYIIWGAVAIFIGLSIAGVGVVPIAILATTIKGEWTITGQIVLLLGLTYGSRALGFYFAQRADKLAYEPSYEEKEKY